MIAVRLGHLDTYYMWASALDSRGERHGMMVKTRELNDRHRDLVGRDRFYYTDGGRESVFVR